jgi:hypothetical protein
MALGYPNTPTIHDKTAAKNLILSLQNLLPCEKCRVNFIEKMKADVFGGARLENAVQCSENLIKYVHDLEVAVASSNGGKVLSFESTRANVMSNTYIHPPSSILSSNATTISPAVWATFPLAVVAAVVITWAVTKMACKKRAQ